MRLTVQKFVFGQIKTTVLRALGRQLSTPSYSIVQPGVVGPPRSIPDYISKPPYALTGVVPPSPSAPEIKTEEQIEGVWNSCKLARYVLDVVAKSIKVGMTTDEIDRIVHEECIANNAYPSPLLYKDFPKSVCTSVNNVHCHGIPDDRPLEDGDILNVDVSVFYHGYHGDVSETFMIGEVDEAGRKLLTVGKQSLMEGINVCKPGAKFCDIGKAISEHAYSEGFVVIPQITGHGIGSYFHGPPDIFHVPYETPETMKTMEPGMTFTIEPVICEGTEKYKLWPDKWTIVSKDNSRSCQFEHTVLITKSRVEIMTKWYYNDYGEI
ncbi:methionine aminopeptidase 1D, mitochondrial-like [Mercenaria mercenaria]|uniref:methionine aminopeptidase 1D, mitochondrial-like n=1 Tax=Mercenaria mercenaria TaxID=6596 RepID=UPI00234EF870|nr:methionine aminopeptidase 1D, mitochondrial-like [Mercenaria mercenaria]XP_045215721.2 methionine aminopeptidase 1D, mitochondrial-like [Mercenaria mercenaria]XP_053406232.1 methionine aminopeptidase 1D, mitochondrial-like [Mercenaria mercenaria]